MMLVLKIVGGILLGGLLLLLLMYVAFRVFLWYVKYKLGKAFGGLGDMLKAMTGGQMIQTRVELDPVDDDALSAEMLDRVREIESLGFARAGTYQVDGQEVYLAALADPDRRIWASVTQGPIVASDSASAVVDFNSQHEDGRWFSHMNMKDLGLVPPEGIHKTRFPDMPAADLLERHLGERPEGPYVEATVENAEAAIQRAVHDEGLLRAIDGGLTEAELRANLASQNTNATDDDVESLRALSRGQAQGVLDEAFTEAFREQTTMSVADWEAVEDRLLVVHAMTDPATLARQLHPEADDTLEESTAASLGNGEARRDNFATANAALPATEQLKPIGEATVQAGPRTLVADVYAGRDWNDFDEDDDEED